MITAIFLSLEKLKYSFTKPFATCMSANKFLQLRVDTWSRKLNIILSLSFQDKTSTKKQQHILEAIRVTSSKTSSEYANFSKSSGQGHKTKGQILQHLYGSFWIKSSEILVFMFTSSIYCIPRTLVQEFCVCVSTHIQGFCVCVSTYVKEFLFPK